MTLAISMADVPWGVWVGLVTLLVFAALVVVAGLMCAAGQADEAMGVEGVDIKSASVIDRPLHGDDQAESELGVPKEVVR